MQFEAQVASSQLRRNCGHPAPNPRLRDFREWLRLSDAALRPGSPSGLRLPLSLASLLIPFKVSKDGNSTLNGAAARWASPVDSLGATPWAERVAARHQSLQRPVLVANHTPSLEVSLQLLFLGLRGVLPTDDQARDLRGSILYQSPGSLAHPKPSTLELALQPLGLRWLLQIIWQPDFDQETSLTSIRDTQLVHAMECLLELQDRHCM
mmetsp:Transcript_11354/g.28722  ORF Transcript_11354/g.28722 Transcript_11354/m.28722 type:complete len:209 (+) Transcript_11354:300-926(+)